MVISGISHVAEPKGESQWPMEQVTMTYGAIVQTFTAQTGADKVVASAPVKSGLAKGAKA